jgi:hypothetical protein
MTTKRARCRRLVRSNDCVSIRKDNPYLPFMTATAICGTLLAHVSSPYRSKIRRSSRWSVVLRRYPYDGMGEWLHASTRLALHDSILATGWPSPWMEVKP